jgi:hypothetical protein
MASPIAPRGYRPPLGAYRLVVPGGGPVDLTGGAPAQSEDVLAISGPTALRVERNLTGGAAATSPSGRYFLGRVLLDEAGSARTVRRRVRIGAPSRGPGLSELATRGREPWPAPASPPPLDDDSVLPREQSEATPRDARSIAPQRPSRGATDDGAPADPLAARAAAAQVVPAQPARRIPALPKSDHPAPASVRNAASDELRQAPFGVAERESRGRWTAAPRARIDEPRALPDLARPFSWSGAVTGLEPGMWSVHRPGSTATYRHWTYAWNYHDEPQVVGGIPLSGLSRPRYPQLPSALRFRYAGAPLWWVAPKTDAPLDPEHGSSPGARAMQAGRRAASSAAAIWRSILVAGAPQEDATGGMDTGREASADAMSSVARSLEVLPAPLASAVASPTPASGAPAYIAMSSSGAAGAVSSATAAVKAQAQARARSVEMSIVAAIPPAPPPLESMSSVAGGAEAPRARGAGHVQSAAHGHHKEADDVVSHSKIEGSVDAIAQRIYHRIRRRIESDRERFGG